MESLARSLHLGGQRHSTFSAHLHIIDLYNVPLVEGESRIKWRFKGAAHLEKVQREAVISTEQHEGAQWDSALQTNLTVDGTKGKAHKKEEHEHNRLATIARAALHPKKVAQRVGDKLDDMVANISNNVGGGSSLERASSPAARSRVSSYQSTASGRGSSGKGRPSFRNSSGESSSSSYSGGEGESSEYGEAGFEKTPRPLNASTFSSSRTPTQQHVNSFRRDPSSSPRAEDVGTPPSRQATNMSTSSNHTVWASADSGKGGTLSRQPTASSPSKGDEQQDLLRTEIHKMEAKGSTDYVRLHRHTSGFNKHVVCAVSVPCKKMTAEEQHVWLQEQEQLRSQRFMDNGLGASTGRREPMSQIHVPGYRLEPSPVKLTIRTRVRTTAKAEEKNQHSTFGSRAGSHTNLAGLAHDQSHLPQHPLGQHSGSPSSSTANLLGLNRSKDHVPKEEFEDLHLGEVVLNLSEFVSPSSSAPAVGRNGRNTDQWISRRYLLTGGKTNALLRVAVKMNLIAGERSFVAPTLDTGLITPLRKGSGKSEKDKGQSGSNGIMNHKNASSVSVNSHNGAPSINYPQTSSSASVRSSSLSPEKARTPRSRSSTQDNSGYNAHVSAAESNARILIDAIFSGKYQPAAPPERELPRSEEGGKRISRKSSYNRLRYDAAAPAARSVDSLQKGKDGKASSPTKTKTLFGKKAEGAERASLAANANASGQKAGFLHPHIHLPTLRPHKNESHQDGYSSSTSLQGKERMRGASAPGPRPTGRMSRTNSSGSAAMSFTNWLPGTKKKQADAEATEVLDPEDATTPNANVNNRASMESAFTYNSVATGNTRDGFLAPPGGSVGGEGGGPMVLRTSPETLPLPDNQSADEGVSGQGVLQAFRDPFAKKVKKLSSSARPERIRTVSNAASERSTASHSSRRSKGNEAPPASSRTMPTSGSLSSMSQSAGEGQRYWSSSDSPSDSRSGSNSASVENSGRSSPTTATTATFGGGVGKSVRWQEQAPHPDLNRTVRGRPESSQNQTPSQRSSLEADMYFVNPAQHVEEDTNSMRSGLSSGPRSGIRFEGGSEQDQIARMLASVAAKQEEQARLRAANSEREASLRSARSLTNLSGGSRGSSLRSLSPARSLRDGNHSPERSRGRVVR